MISRPVHFGQGVEIQIGLDNFLTDVFGGQNSLDQSLKIGVDTKSKFCTPYTLNCNAKFHKTTSTLKNLYIKPKLFFSFRYHML